jgi:hypothetical protein
MKTMIDTGALTARQAVARDITRVALATAAILLVPLVAMRFTDEVDWTVLDFAVAGALLAGTGFMYVVATRNATRLRRKALIGILLAIALILVWSELAVGLFGTPFAGS